MEFKKPIQDDIYLLICNSMAKMPDRAAISRQIYERYNVNALSELTDAESMEVLSYCDPINHTKINKERNEKEYRENLVLLDAAIEKFVDDNKEDYSILSDGPGFFLITKRIKPVVHVHINASVFQPIERNENREYLIIVLIQTEEEWEPDEAIKNLVSMKIKHLKILNWKQVKAKLESIE